MTRTLVLTSVLCVALLPAAFPFAAKADPRILTASELATVTAGQATLPPIQMSQRNTTLQVARAFATSFAICAGCVNATVTAISSATASNVAELTNAAF